MPLIRFKECLRGKIVSSISLKTKEFGNKMTKNEEEIIKLERKLVIKESPEQEHELTSSNKAWGTLNAY